MEVIVESFTKIQHSKIFLATLILSTTFEQSCLVMDPSQRLSCEELLELPYFQEEGGANWGREGERTGRRHEKGSRRRQPGVSRITNEFVTSRPEFTLQELRRCAWRDHCLL